MLVARELRDFVRSQVARLPPDQGVAVTLYHMDGLAVSEVAEILGVPENTVKSHLSATLGSAEALVRQLGEGSGLAALAGSMLVLGLVAAVDRLFGPKLAARLAMRV